MTDNEEMAYGGLVANGFLMIALFLALIVLGVFGLFQHNIVLGRCIIAMYVIIFVCLKGFVMLEPNQASVMLFFGEYRGTLRQTGLCWVNPFMTSRKISLRINNLDVEPIKVNDKVGNPILIGLVLVWRINDTYRVVFDLNSRSDSSAAVNSSANSFVAVQSDAALREVAGRYPYDDENGVESTLTLRSGGEEINDELEQKLNDRLSMAGIEVVEARINYLAYAPEIAAVMLRRQQASAIITAREKIVEGAVSMVKMALDKLEDGNVVKMSETEKASMVSNLLVVLCADEQATPVVGVGE